METHEKQRLQQIETATSRDPPSDEIRDEETAELREGWTTLVRLLEDADRVQAMPGLVLPEQTPATVVWHLRLGTLAALAAGLMIAVTASWLWRSPEQASSSRWLSVVPVPEVSRSELPDSGHALPPADSTIDDRWDDDLDDRLDDLSQQIAGFHGNGYLLDAPFHWLSEQIGELHEEIEEL
jgi:hypothetical protein